jgi:hypothetical protein
MVPQSSLHRTAGVVVLHAIPDERGNLTVIGLNGNLHLHFSFGGKQETPHVIGKVELIGGPIKINF